MWRLACACVLVLLTASAALAANGDPQRRITAADQAKARSMLLRASDLTDGFASKPSSTSGGGPGCAALDESDLTLTGDASSPDFTRSGAGYVSVGSSAQLYRSVTDANASWRRGTSARALSCIAGYFRKLARKDAAGMRFVSVRRLDFPAVAPLTARFRVVFSAPAAGGSLRVYFEVVVLQRGRAQVSLLFGSAAAPVPQRDQVALAGVVSARMARALRVESGPSA
ncbi:MAG TPA: hypothetical protein VH950_18590 [Gaiellaceae bacterium]|jgi:hypothetical protein